MNKYNENRTLMKSSMSDYNLISTADIANGIPQPPFQKPISDDSILVDLPPVNSMTAPKADFFECTTSRISRRMYSEEPITIDELSFLLWCTQGVKKVIGGYWNYLKDGSGRNYLRPVAEGGCIPAYETYLAVNNVLGVDSGIWRYLPLSHQLIYVKEVEDLPMSISNIFTNPSQNQSYTERAGAIFFWVCRPYYGEWRYKETSHKIMLIDLGHISHQLYLATEAVGCGCCAIGGYYQDKADELIGVDGDDEFTVLCASVGHVIPEEKNWVDRYPDIR
ncbi:SagB/ThcOx family dehydrogenase [Clostridium frigidicarnis]|uniref:SagB-type dehydrogenase domain-containing protein n=1 Tax=Clostridium frigidicarnis TaxID=84698 RepID=A0A1I1AG87_9CLOT|nr:SagB/ThcOx family dehydrogenase [Clostridium frigidicarnis]SFB37019.1 SagB-type dehydrogenase domain-containing protein [Clostridium frigidicarnis]